jgi:carboxyl-terminal processing protease
MEDTRPEAVFARQLVGVCSQITDQYVRPVARPELVYTALSGLYEAARLPVPSRLRAEIDAITSDAELVELIRRGRETIGAAEALQGQNPLVICCQAMARSLDPYSGVVTGEVQRHLVGLEQEGGGIGVELHDCSGHGPLVVKTVVPGGPAQRAGLQPDDRITQLDCLPVQDIPPEQAYRLLTQAPIDFTENNATDSPLVAVTWERRGLKGPTTASLTRARFRVETVLGVSREDDHSWTYWIDSKQHLAHIRLTSLSKGTSVELQDILARLQAEGLRGLLLDLRWSPGGYLDEAVDVARLFLHDGIIATVKMRTREDIVHRCTKEGPFTDFPLVVLINAETSGGAELIAAALQDHHRAIVFGQRTLGKASVQTPVHLGVGQLGMKLTSGTFERPSGGPLHRFPDSKDSDEWGVLPDAGKEFRVSAELGKTLKGWWIQQTIRPGSATYRLPLDDPSADPQRQEAVTALQDFLDHRTVQSKIEE